MQAGKRIESFINVIAVWQIFPRLRAGRVSWEVAVQFDAYFNAEPAWLDIGDLLTNTAHAPRR